MAGSSESRGGLQDLPFCFQSSSENKVLISWRGRQVMILKGARARSFLLRVSEKDPAEQQLIMAKITGNFKRGNESKE